MRIDLNRPYKSIIGLTTEDLPDFAVLIGRSGTGKTQLLEALTTGAASISGIRLDQIEKYDLSTFQPPNTNEAHRYVNQFAHNTAERYMSHSVHGQTPIKLAATIFKQYTNEIERASGTQARVNFEEDLRTEIRQLPDFAIFGSSNPVSQYHKTLNDQVMARLDQGEAGRRSVGRSARAQNSFQGNQAALLSAAMKLYHKLPHELTYDDIIQASHFEGETLSNSISAVFCAYKINQFIWAHNRVEREHIPFDDLINEYEAKNSPPWETLRTIISDLRGDSGEDGIFNFDFSDPGSYKLHMGNQEGFSFKSEMTNLTSGTQYDLHSLSSGEKILMALCLASFNQSVGRRRPKLILLDELDAMLHPSMIAVLVTVLKDLFVSRGTKVLMTSHSPMTVGTLDEEETFRVERSGGAVYVSSTTKSEAITELSEGLATVDVGLKIAAYDEAKVTILTEGHNAKHLKKWAQLHFPDKVRVFEGLEPYSSDSQLLTYGRLLGRVNTNTHFLVVWDCDAAEKAHSLRTELPGTAKVTPFAFARRQENTIIQSGIENNYDDDVLESFSIKKTDNDGTLLGRELPKNRKASFADHVLHEGTSHYFTHFQDLNDIVNRILGSPEKV